MQWGACLAGLAIEHSMLGAAHALANPLTAHCRIPHGQAVAVCLPHVVRFNAPTCSSQYAELTALIDGGAGRVELSDWLTKLLAALGLRTTLSSLQVELGRLADFAAEASSQWTARHNPRPLSADDALALYQAAW
jgi:alcohol dehydrogenase